MHLMLRIASTGARSTTDVVATVEPGHTVDELRRACAALPGMGDGAVLVRAGEALEPSTTLAELGLVSGEELTLSDPRGVAWPRPKAVVRIEAVLGPASGWAVEVGPGTYRLGRPFSGGASDPTYLAIADPTVSRPQLEVVVADDLSVSVRDLPEARNPLLIDGAIPASPVAIGPGTELRIGDSVLACRPVDAAPPVRLDQLGQIAFHRTPLRPSRPQAVELPKLARVPTSPDPARFSWLSFFAPVLGAGVMAVVLGEPRFAFFALLAPVTGGANWFETRKRNREKHAREVQQFEKRLQDREERYAAAIAAEETTRLAAAPDIADLRRRVERRDRTLWSRGRDIPEFLTLRVGTGPAEPLVTAEYAADGDEDLIAELEAQDERFRRFERVPVAVPLQELGVLGMHGPRREVAGLAKALVLQAVSLHSPENLVVVAATSPEMDIATWLKWVPHTHATGSPLEGPHLASSRAGADHVLRAVLEVAEFRAGGSQHGVDRRWPWMLVVLDRLIDPDPHLVAQVLDHCPDVGISVLWVSDTADRIPPQCQVVAELADRSLPGPEQLSQLWFTDPDRPPQTFAADGVDREVPDVVARSLAPLRDASSTTSTSSIPRMVPLMSVHGIDAVTPAWIQQEWAVDRRGEGGYALEAVVGMTADGPLKLDLVSDGPHGLIGGTSGAGKSELVQSLVAGLVAYQSPRDLSLLFIDFKGGSASEVFKDLPHVSGRVTDLDEAMAIRARVSLRAELRRRVSLFSDLAVKDMADMRRLHRDQAPPSLVIVIDEFATLVKQLPDFVADIVDIAQRGRSYGIHLLLATQRPSASVDDNILANTNLRISLRMLDRVESMSILNVPDASEIPVPLKGRALARLGPGQLVEFQSAFCGAPVPTVGGRQPVHLAPFGIGSLIGAAPPPAPLAAGEGDPRTHLDLFIDAILAAGHPRVDQIWNELLPEHLPFADVDRERLAAGPDAPGTARHRVLLGKADDPANQRQELTSVDLESGGGLLVLGVAGSGRSTVLRTIAASAALDDARAGGGTLALVGLDFASGGLRSVAALPQCAGIGTIDDLEATTRIIETLDGEVARRRAEAGRRAAPWPTIILLVDGYANLVDALQNARGGQEQASDQWLAAFHRVVVDGRQFDVHAVITADRSGSIRNALFAAMTRRLVLRQIDLAETNGLGVPSTATFLPGSGYLDGLRVQVATLAPIGGEVGDEEAVAALAATLDVAPVNLLPPPLPTTATRPGPTDDLGPWGGLVGIADVTAERVPFDLASLDVLVTGAPRSGKSWALRAMAEQLEAPRRTIFAIGAEDSGLRDFPWKAAGWGAEEVAGTLAVLKAELEFPTNEAVLVVDDVDLLDGFALDAAVAGLGTNRRVKVLGSTTSFGYSNNELVKRIRAGRQVLYLQPASSREVAETIGVTRLPLLRHGLDFPPGRAMFVRNRVPTVVQVYRPDPA